MAALRKTSGFLAPVIIDTGIAKISSDYRTNFANFLTSTLGDAQIVLLVSDVEFTRDFKDCIVKNISDEYILHHLKEKGLSEVSKNGK